MFFATVGEEDGCVAYIEYGVHHEVIIAFGMTRCIAVAYHALYVAMEGIFVKIQGCLTVAVKVEVSVDLHDDIF